MANLTLRGCDEELAHAFKATSRRRGVSENANLLELEEFLASPRVSVHSLGEETAIFYAEIYMSLRAAGKPIPTNDLWIAAATLETGSILLSGDVHFDAVRGLIRR